MQRTRFPVIALVVICLGCHKISPTNDWNKFHPDLTIKHYDEVGPWGGWSYFGWESSNVSTFDMPSVIAFAKVHKWELVSTQSVSKNMIENWKSRKGPYFPLGYRGFAPDENDTCYDRFPRWFSENSILYIFKTGWITSLGGVERPANAYVLITTNGSKMALYHLWGE